MTRNSTADKLASLAMPLRSGHLLRINFCFQHDRYTHQWMLVDGEREIPILTSIVSGDDAAWPPSPAIQELVSAGGEPDALLGVGSAGTSYWSSSFTVDLAAREFLIDYACRLKQRGPFLGATYRIEPAMAATVHNQGVRLSGKGENLEISARCESVGRMEHTVDDSEQIVQIALDEYPWDLTVRWQLRVRECSVA